MEIILLFYELEIQNKIILNSNSNWQSFEINKIITGFHSKKSGKRGVLRFKL
jgi:hypothetical protein